MKKLYTLSALLIAGASFGQVVISQVYGGGGNTGATYTHDFVELFNRGSQAVTLSGYSLQYGAAANPISSSNVQILPDITIQPGQYFLLQEGQGAGGTTALPTPDFVPASAETALNMGGTNGKIVLASTTNPVTGVTDATVVDYVGYGTSVDYEGTAAVAALSNTTAAFRANNGCQDTNDNAADFTTAAPAPRNTASPVSVCVTGLDTEEIAGLKVYPNPLASGSVLNIASNNGIEKSVAIYDVLGKQVFAGATVNGAVNTTDLKAGIYIVKITEGTATATRKLIVQ